METDPKKKKLGKPVSRIPPTGLASMIGVRVDPSGMGSSNPEADGRPVANWLHNVLSALDQTMTTGFPGMRGAGPPPNPRPEIMIPLMMGTMAGEPGPDLLGPLLKKAPASIRAAMENMVIRGTPRTVGQLKEGVPLDRGKFVMRGVEFGHVHTPDGSMGRVTVNDVPESMPIADAVNIEVHADDAIFKNEPPLYGDPGTMNFTIHNSVDNTPVAKVYSMLVPANGGTLRAESPRDALVIDLGSATPYNALGNEFEFDPGRGLGHNALGLSGLRDAMGHVLAVYRKNLGTNIEKVTGIRVKNDHALHIPATDIRRVFEATWKGFFGVAAAVPAIEVINSRDEKRSPFDDIGSVR